MIQLTNNAMTVLEKRYLIRDEKGEIIETPKELFMRVADKVASVEKPETREGWTISFYNIMSDLYFLPNTPVLINFGRPNVKQMGSACFVLPVGDSMEEIFDAVKWAALVHKSAGGTGFSFTRLRERGAQVGGRLGISSGPIEFMKVFNSATEAVKQGATRRGANMGILSVDHPDIEEFIHLKDDLTQMNNFNISVAVTDAFIEAYKNNTDYDILDPRTEKPYILNGQVVRKNARKIMKQIAESAYQTGEPGVVYIDRVNQTNPVPSERIWSSNPCAEQFLPDFDSCTLGSIDVGKFVSEGGEVDWKLLGHVIFISTRFLDNVLDVNEYPLPQVKEQTLNNRRIGLGIMGFADFLIKRGIPYDSKEGLDAAEELMKFVQDMSMAYSEELAKEKGVFPNYKKSVYFANGKKKMRNATVTTVAPTGTISIIAGCSGGLEPLFAVAFSRLQLNNTNMVEVNPVFEKIAKERGFYSKELMEKIMHEGSIQKISEIPDDVKAVFRVASDISPEYHCKMLAAFQKYTCNSCSKTINFSNNATVKNIEEVYIKAFDMGCKSVSVYRDGCRPNQVLSVGKTTSKKETNERPTVVSGLTYQINTNLGKFYVTINKNNDIPIEVFFAISDVSPDLSGILSALARSISLHFKHGNPVKDLVKSFKKVKTGTTIHYNGKVFKSIPYLVAVLLEENFLSEKVEPVTSVCDSCGSKLVYQEGCEKCLSCNYSKCG